MSKVHLHNSTYGSEAEALLAWNESKRELQMATFWNIWRRRGVGSAIEDGTRILLVGSWPDKGETVRRVLWDAKAWDVQKWDGVDWDTAVRKLGRWTGVGVAGIREDPYTASKQSFDSPLFVMGWRPELVQWINEPLSRDVRVSRNGWAVFDEAEVITWKTRPKASGKGQGRRLDLASRKAVENRAMDVAKLWCMRRGWTEISNTSTRRAWDYEALDETGQLRFIEVKGSTGDNASMEVTAGEVRASKSHGDAHLLIAVGGITLTKTKAGTPTARGGKIHVFDPWTPKQEELLPTRFAWTPEVHRAKKSKA